MDRADARRLMEATGEFYRRVSASFSATRGAAWPGWERAVDVCADALAPGARVLDVACGNLRFERFLSQRGIDAGALAVDSCDALAAELPDGVRYLHLDIASALLEDGALARALGEGGFDLAVCFGFMHHLPLPEQRERLMEALAEALRPGGRAIVSFWRFGDDGRMLAKARAATARGLADLDVSGLGENDWLLGWQDRSDVYRFCHHFTEEEVDGLVAHVRPRARELARFSADGRTGALNRYVVLQA